MKESTLGNALTAAAIAIVAVSPTEKAAAETVNTPMGSIDVKAEISCEGPALTVGRYHLKMPDGKKVEAGVKRVQGKLEAVASMLSYAFAKPAAAMDASGSVSMAMEEAVGQDEKICGDGQEKPAAPQRSRKGAPQSGEKALSLSFRWNIGPQWQI